MGERYEWAASLEQNTETIGDVEYADVRMFIDGAAAAVEETGWTGRLPSICASEGWIVSGVDNARMYALYAGDGVLRIAPIHARKAARIEPAIKLFYLGAHEMMHFIQHQENRLISNQQSPVYHLNTSEHEAHTVARRCVYQMYGKWLAPVAGQLYWGQREYAVAFSMANENGPAVCAGSVYADDETSARAEAEYEIRRKWPTNDGWHSHQTAVYETVQSQLRRHGLKCEEVQQ